MTRFSVYGRDMPDGDPLEVARIHGNPGDWHVWIEPVNDPTRILLVDFAFTKWGAKRTARKLLRIAA